MKRHKKVLTKEIYDHIMIMYEIDDELINWNKLLSTYDFPEDMFIKVIDKLKPENLYYIFMFQDLSEKSILLLIDHFPNYEEDIWLRTSFSQTLSEEFMDKYQDKLAWEPISSDQLLSKTFILKHVEKINWYNLSRCNRYLTEEVIRAFSDKLSIADIIDTVGNKELLSDEFKQTLKVWQ